MSEVGDMKWWSRTFFPESGELSKEWSVGAGEEKRRKTTSANENAKAKDIEAAEQRVLLEKQQEEEKSAARRFLAAQPTSGFGANTNVARSFLTSL